jgi:hypothetical protein
MSEIIPEIWTLCTDYGHYEVPYPLIFKIELSNVHLATHYTSTASVLLTN